MTTQRHVRGIAATGYTGDGTKALHDDGAWKVPAGGGSGGSGTVTDWTDMPLQPAFASNEASFGLRPQYRKVGDEVQFRGTFKMAAGGNVPTAMTDLAVLPAGFGIGRPGGELTPVTYGGGEASSAARIRLQIYPDGTVKAGAVGPNTTTWGSLDGVRFSSASTTGTAPGSGGTTDYATHAEVEESLTLGDASLLLTAASGGQGLTSDGDAFYWGKSNGTGVAGDIVKISPVTGATIATFAGSAPPHAAGADFLPARSSLLFSSGGANTPKLNEVSNDTGAVLHAWDLTGVDYNAGGLVAWDTSTTDTVFLLTSDLTTLDFKIRRIRLHDDNTWTDLGLVYTSTSLGVPQGMCSRDGHIYYLTDANGTGPLDNLKRITRFSMGATELVKDRTWGVTVTDEAEGLTFHGGQLYLGTLGLKIYRAPFKPWHDNVLADSVDVTGPVKADTVILTSPNGTEYPLSVADDGTLSPSSGGPGGTGGVQTIVPGTGISVDDTDPANPVVSATGGGGGALAVCSVANTAGTSVPNATATILPLAVEEYDPAEMHDPVSNNSRITITVSGVYLVHAEIGFSFNGSGGRVAQLLKNGAQIHSSVNGRPGSSGSVYLPAPARTFTAGDYIELRGYQDSGSALTATARVSVTQVA